MLGARVVREVVLLVTESRCLFAGFSGWSPQTCDPKPCWGSSEAKPGSGGIKPGPDCRSGASLCFQRPRRCRAVGVNEPLWKLQVIQAALTVKPLSPPSRERNVLISFFSLWFSMLISEKISVLQEFSLCCCCCYNLLFIILPHGSHLLNSYGVCRVWGVPGPLLIPNSAIEIVKSLSLLLVPLGWTKTNNFPDRDE